MISCYLDTKLSHLNGVTPGNISISIVDHLFAYNSMTILDITQLAQNLQKVRFLKTESVLVTEWISGRQQNIQFERINSKFLEVVSDTFEVEVLRIYILQSPDFKWQNRIELHEDNFMEFVDRVGIFKRPKVSKVYAICNDVSPDSSPVAKEIDVVDEISEASSIGTGRSGQREFTESINRRDNGACVFCGTSDGLLEAAHYLPVEQKAMLNDFDQCVKYNICSIMDSANGILLCGHCHRCFDANLVCIDSETGILRIADSLLANEREKWSHLVGRVVSASRVAWPCKQLLKYREEAMQEAIHGNTE